MTKPFSPVDQLAERASLATPDRLESSPDAVSSVSDAISAHPTSRIGEKRKASNEPFPGLPFEPVAKPTDTTGPHTGDTTEGTDTRPVSKRKLKRLRRQQAWDEAKEDRKARRQDKRHARQARKRAEKELLVSTTAETINGDYIKVLLTEPAHSPTHSPTHGRPVPVSFVLDCGFEEYMHDNEIVSLSNQIVRSYSENRKAAFRAHFIVSSFGGKLKERFETTMKNHHTNWRGVQFVEGDFVQAAIDARSEMAKTPMKGRKVQGLFVVKEQSVARDEPGTGVNSRSSPNMAEHGLEKDVEHQDIVYLTSDSPNTLHSLQAGMTYIVGGLVDRNREKGLCYRRAQARGVCTAKLPIGEYMAMSSRHILTTNQVVEIMSNFLAEGDWGKAFINVIPQRKGGTLRSQVLPASHAGLSRDDDVNGGLRHCLEDAYGGEAREVDKGEGDDATVLRKED